MEKQFADVSHEAVMELCAKIDFAPEPHPEDGGVLGRFLSSRPEVKLAALNPGQPIGVSDAIPEISRAFFLALARHLGKPQVVADTNGVQLFLNTGQVMTLPT